MSRPKQAGMYFGKGVLSNSALFYWSTRYLYCGGKLPILWDLLGFLKLYTSRDHIHNKLLLIVLMVTAGRDHLTKQPERHKQPDWCVRTTAL